MPKCLTIIKGKPILQHLLDAFCLQGIKKIIIATGYLEHHIRAYMNQYAQDIQVEYVFNPNYKTTNNIYSLWLTRQFINEAFVLVESDLIFDVNFFAPMVYPDCIALSIILPWMNGTNVSLNDDNQVEAVHMSISANQHQCYKTVNICSLSLNSWYKVLDRMDNYIFEKNSIIIMKWFFQIW